ncbi:hypothetical protein BDE27_0276 [Xenorhabdus ehlersii]|uniref:Uncharacterized protein n=1 Tax=Xenorhabdus ehlersii TaxID=290111 RepID=A0A2D0IMB6_9GAMM|nr:hypothetical protein Xehl_03187 [Xenorhabdus ehlersii]RKE92624.1 hypothetical protein BDE27_0276 [Xenorhabdus ehlersii]
MALFAAEKGDVHHITTEYRNTLRKDSAKLPVHGEISLYSTLLPEII